MNYQARSTRNRQAGASTVEFALVSALFLLLFMATIEIGRAMFTYNVLTESTRMGARAAAVCAVQSDNIAKSALFNNMKLIPDLKAAHVNVSYLDANGAVVPNPSPGNAEGFMNVRYVQVSIRGYTLHLMIPGFGSITLPPFTTTLPRESLGIVPSEASGC